MKDLLPEVLLNIFDLVVHTPSHDSLLFAKRSKVAEVKDWSTFRFVQECRFSQLSNWDHVPFDKPPYPASPQSRLPGMAELDFHRVAALVYNLWSRPLKLVFRDGQDHYQEHGNAITEMLLSAAAHHRRWASLKIKLRQILLPMHVVTQAVSSAELPMLQTLAFSFNMVPGGQGRDFNQVWGNIARSSPQLREMQMWSAMDYDRGFLDGLPLDRLTSLILPKVDIELGSHFMASLRRCTSLEALSISIREYCQPQPWDPSTLAVPTLRNLYVQCDGTEGINNLMGPLYLPSLTHLSVHVNSLTRPHPLLAVYGAVPGMELPAVSQQTLKLEEALDRWRPNLLFLSFRDENAPKFQDFFLPLMRHPALQSLEDLRVGGIAGVEFIDALTIDPNTPGSPLMPGLKTIHIESAFLNNSHPGAITKMVRSRVDSQNANHLRTIRVDFLSKNEMAQEIGQWEGVQDRHFQQVDKLFEWIGTGQRSLEREFMVEDFSMIQNW
ncbi:hypothetical protein BKA70DRAFT_1401653 [Coprinopsis sp. MPI-PUGE-AT-0042]|nr:hypothetical protein BKA70DRAFT_1401653 [Coprinopsis sp. MPI-PUGE-AT-0042]